MEDPVANYLVAEHLATRVAEGWLEILPIAPEASIDGMLIGCERFDWDPTLVQRESALVVESVDIDGEDCGAGLWEALKSATSDQLVHVFARWDGVRVLLLGFVYGNHKSYNIECVYKDISTPDLDPCSAEFAKRVHRWCDLLVKLGDWFGAARVEAPNPDGPQPLILWER